MSNGVAGGTKKYRLTVSASAQPTATTINIVRRENFKGQLFKRDNVNVHRAAANIIVFKSRAARGSVCNVLLSRVSFPSRRMHLPTLCRKFADNSGVVIANTRQSRASLRQPESEKLRSSVPSQLKMQTLTLRCKFCPNRPPRTIPF